MSVSISISFFFVIQKIINIDILNDIKIKNYFKKNNNDNNDKNSEFEKTAKNNISNVKFANMTNLK
jgi:hypothetical protein